MTVNTIGIVVVAALAANAEETPPVATITATCLRTIGQRRQPTDFTFGPAVFNRRVHALGIASLFQTLVKCGRKGGVGTG